MEALVLFVLMVTFLSLLFGTKKLEDTPEFQNATPEEQQKMLEERDRQKKQREDLNSSYDYGTSSSSEHSSSSSSSFNDDHYNNPSTGLPMSTPGTGGVDTSGRPYGT